MLVGIEDNIAKDKSKVLLIYLSDSSQSPKQLVVASRSGIIKRETAGATGFTQLNNGQYLAAVGDWSSRNIDFYISDGSEMKRFDSVGTFHAPVQKNWPSYQSINLLTDKTGNLYLIGFALDGTKNRADLFKADLNKTSVELTPLATRYFTNLHGAGFRYGSGIAVSNKGSLAIISCCRKAGHRTAINVFK